MCDQCEEDEGFEQEAENLGEEWLPGDRSPGDPGIVCSSRKGAPEDLERVREGLARIAGGEKSCAHCGEEIPATRNKRHNKYCDNVCQNAERSSKILEAWKSGEDSGTKAGGRLKTVVRNFIFKKFDNECCECGWSEVNPFSGRVALEVDHIDGDSSNNTEENLRLICPNCHALTSTYKSLNKGRASQERLQYSRLK